MCKYSLEAFGVYVKADGVMPRCRPSIYFSSVLLSATAAEDGTSFFIPSPSPGPIQLMPCGRTV